MRRLLKRLILLLCFACNTGSQIRSFILSSNQAVQIDRYPYYFRLMSEDEIKKKGITHLIKDGEKHRFLLHLELETKLGISLPQPIKYNYTGYDSINQRIIIRYYASNPQSRIIAGWQAQLVYQLPSLALEKIYISEVPLE